MPETNAFWRTQNLGHLLFTANGWCIRDKLRVLHHGGFGTISDAQLTLFHNVDLDGTSLTTIAARAGLTKQSMIELVDKAEALAFVRREPDPNDRRAKIVRLTPEGHRVLEILRRGIIVAEQHVERAVGSVFLQELKSTLGIYASVPLADVNPNVARIFSLAARRFAQDALSVVHKREYHEVTEVLLALFRNLDLGGTRLTVIAARARMTKQSMRELVDRAERLGFVERLPDPIDKRAKTIMFTPAGIAMLDEMRRGIVQAEEHLAMMAGHAFLSRLKARLIDYNASASLLAHDRSD